MDVDEPRHQAQPATPIFHVDIAVEPTGADVDDDITAKREVRVSQITMTAASKIPADDPIDIAIARDLGVQ